jgi:hypothetical protein
VATAENIGIVGCGGKPAPKPKPAPTPKPKPAPKPSRKEGPPSGGTKTDASYHHDFSTNACNNMKPDAGGRNTAMSASLSAKLGVPKLGPGSSTCGRKLRVTNDRTGQSVVVTVLDLRSDDLGLDMQTPAFDGIDSDKEGHAKGRHSNLHVQWA